MEKNINIEETKLAAVLDGAIYQEDHPKEGLFFATWGLYIVLANWIENFFKVFSAEFWLIWILVGMGIQVLVYLMLTRQERARVWRLDYVHYLWLFTMGGMFFIIGVFPFLAGLYGPEAISSLVCLWLAGPLIATGVLSRSPLFIAGGIITALCAPLFFIFPGFKLVIFTVQMVFGQILPGLGWFFVKHK